MRTISENAVPNEGPEFALGGDHAVTLYASMVGKLSPDHPNPIVDEANLLAGQHSAAFQSAAQAMSTITSNNSELALAVLTLTLAKHVKERYLEGEGND